MEFRIPGDHGTRLYMELNGHLKPLVKSLGLMVRYGINNVRIFLMRPYGCPMDDGVSSESKDSSVLASLALRGKVARFGASRASVKTEESLIPT